MNARDREDLRLLLEDAEIALRHAAEYGAGSHRDTTTRDASHFVCCESASARRG